MASDIARIVAALSVAYALAGCVAVQTGENTVEMADELSNIRDLQVLRNLGVAISDHDMVPSQIVLGTGQANASTGVSPSLKLPHFDFSKVTKELDLGATVSWSAQWQFNAVADAGDLRTLRDIYVFVTSTDKQYDQLQQFFIEHSEYKTRPIVEKADSSPPNAADKNDQTPNETDNNDQTLGLTTTLKNDIPTPPSPSVSQVTPWTPSHVITWNVATDIIVHGDSIGCMRFQKYELDGDLPPPPGTLPRKNGVPFRRWLFWRKDGDAWGPNSPDRDVKSLGRFNGWEIGTTSLACFDDFIILVQGATPAANAASSGGPKPNIAPP